LGKDNGQQGVKGRGTPAFLLLNQMGGPLTWELAEDLAKVLGPVALFTGHPDTLAKGSRAGVNLFPATPYERGGFARRLISWVRYSLEAFFWLFRWPATIPIVIFSNPPIFPWLGYVLLKLRGQRYAVIVHDVYPECLVRLNILSNRHPVIRLWYRLNRLAYEQACLVVTLGERMAINIEKQFDHHPTNGGRVEIIYPWADTDVIRPIPKEENWFANRYGQVNKLTVMYSGNMGIGHDIETILRAALLLRSSSSIQFLLIGGGPKWAVADSFVKKHKLGNVTLLHWQPETVLPYSLATADVGVVSLEPEFIGLSFPSKSFYYLAAGSALIVISAEESEVGDIVKKYGCGWICRPGVENDLVQVLDWLSRHPEELEKRKRISRKVAQAIGSRKNSRELCSLLEKTMNLKRSRSESA